jgi:hypothetical protein
MKKRITGLFLLSVFLCLPLAAQNVIKDGFVLQGTVLLEYLGSEENVTIPADMKITEIANGVFREKNILSVVIPEGVTKIGDSAFYGCQWLTDVTLPESLQVIGDSAFSNCSKLQSITLLNNIVSIGKTAFDSAGLKSIHLPASVTSIGDDAFYRCHALTEITVDDANDTYTDWDGILFSKDYTAIIRYPPAKEGKNFRIPSFVTNVGDSAFSGCSDLKSVSIGNGVITIGRAAFHGCSGLESIDIPDSVLAIMMGAFVGCSGLKSIDIPDSVINIQIYAFSGCNSLVSVSIGNGVANIWDWAFSQCSSLVSVSMGDSVTTIGTGAFSGCYNLRAITCLASRPPTLIDDLGTSPAIIYVPPVSLAAYKYASSWKWYFDRIRAIED